MAIREGRWDCSSCGSTAIYGRHVDCPGCGRPRPAGVRFYLAHGEPVITDPELLREARAGADWICAHCEASNRALLGQCGGCGAARGGSPTQPVVRHTLASTPRPEAKADAGAPRPRRLIPGTGGSGVGGGPRMRDYAGVAFLGLCILAFAGWRIASRPERSPIYPAMVEGLSWQQGWLVEERTLHDSAGWQLPDSAEMVGQEQRLVRHDTVVERYDTVTRRVPRVTLVRIGSRRVRREVEEEVRTGSSSYVCGQRDLGNGYFEDVECSTPEYETVTRMRTVTEPIFRADTVWDVVDEQRPVLRVVPRYAAWYRFRVPRWVPVRRLIRTGEGAPPRGSPVPPSQPGPNQRVLPWGEEFRVRFRSAAAGEQETWLPYGQWELLRAGRPAAYRPSASGGRPWGLFPADSLPECRRWHRGRGRPPPDSLGCSPRRP